MDWNTVTAAVIISAGVSAVTGGLAGAVYNSRAQKKLQKRSMHASLRQKGIQDFIAWTSKAYELYMANEATWAGRTGHPVQKAP